MNKHQLQQGDVLLLRVKSLPEGCKPRNHRTLAWGEHTGHHHTFEEGVIVMDAPDGRVFVHNITSRDVEIRHQEHKPVIVQPGMYEFGAVIEKDWMNEMVRAVID